MKSTALKKIVLTTTFLCVMQVGNAFCEVLPWQKGAAPQTKAQPVVEPAHVATPESSDQRTQDDRRLNELATRFYKAKPKHKNIIGELKSVLKDVKAFHEELLQRTYNAVDIIRDTENLEGRVSRQLSHLQAQEKAEAATPTTTK